MTPGRWRRALLAGLAPLLLLGFMTSALANRLVFAAWGLAAGAAYTAALHRAVRRGAGVAAPEVVAALVVSLALFALLAYRHREILGLALAALEPV